MNEPPAASSDTYLMSRSDEAQESIRLDLQHHVWLSTLDKELSRVPFLTTPRCILDVGCGTGAWAYAVAELWPDAHVTAVDLTSPSSNASDRVTFKQMNADETWQLPKHFDFVHVRMLSSGIHDWPNFLRRCWEHLVPGGWIELLDLSHPFRAAALPADRASPFVRFGHAANKAWAEQGLDFYSTSKHLERLHGLGFAQIEEFQYQWPLGTWSNSEKMKMIGEHTFQNFRGFLAKAGVLILRGDPELGEEAARALVTEAEIDVQQKSHRHQYYFDM